MTHPVRCQQGLKYSKDICSQLAFLLSGKNYPLQSSAAAIFGSKTQMARNNNTCRHFPRFAMICTILPASGIWPKFRQKQLHWNFSWHPMIRAWVIKTRSLSLTYFSYDVLLGTGCCCCYSFKSKPQKRLHATTYNIVAMFTILKRDAALIVAPYLLLAISWTRTTRFSRTAIAVALFATWKDVAFLAIIANNWQMLREGQKKGQLTAQYEKCKTHVTLCMRGPLNFKLLRVLQCPGKNGSRKIESGKPFAYYRSAFSFKIVISSRPWKHYSSHLTISLCESKMLMIIIIMMEAAAAKAKDTL